MIPGARHYCRDWGHAGCSLRGVEGLQRGKQNTLSRQVDYVCRPDNPQEKASAAKENITYKYIYIYVMYMIQQCKIQIHEYDIDSMLVRV